MKHTFSIPYLFNPGLLTGRLPNHLLKKVKKAVNDPSARKQKSMTKDLVASIKNEYVTPEIPELVEYIDSMYQAWMETYKTQNIPYEISTIWTNYMQKGEFNPNHNHPNALAVFVIWVTIPYDVQKELEYNGWDNKQYPPKNASFEFTYNMLAGGIMNAPVFVDKSMEGTVTMFPSSMIHCVYPFRTSDGERISIAGNIYSKRD